MTHIFEIPLSAFALPFNRIWKRVLMHLAIAAFFGLLWMPVYHYDLFHAGKIALMLFISDVTQAFVHIIIYHRLSMRYDWIRHTAKRIIYSIVFHFAGMYVVFFSTLTVYIHFVFHASYEDAFGTLVNLWVLPLVLTAVSMTFAICAEFFGNWKKSFAAEEQLNTEMMSYKYEALRNQVNPHFLLGSFGTLKSLVRAEPQQAVEFIQKLSDLYRRVLDVKDQEFISLQDELSYIVNYIELLRIRFRGALSVRVNVVAERDDLIVPLALQSLLEHAVVYFDGEAEVAIDLVKEDDHIILKAVKTNALKEADFSSSSLKALEQQYQFYSRKPLRYQEDEKSFSIFVPLLKQA